MCTASVKTEASRKKATFMEASDRRIHSILIAGVKEKVTELKKNGQSCASCVHLKAVRFHHQCSLKNKAIEPYNICDRHLLPYTA